MAVYGRSIYGQEFYGYDIPPAFRVDPFVAKPVDYGTISINWAQPSGTIVAYRLIKNRFGFPTDQDDGELLIDSLSYPGNAFVDTNVIPGEYHYYAFYVLLSFQGNNWVRSAQAACLMPRNYASGLQLHTLIPAFYHLQTSDGILDTAVDSFPSEVLDFFCNVIGWGFDYLKTQYDTYLHINDPWKIPLTDLLALAQQLGLNINPDIHPYSLRKAVYFNATVNQQRGTLTGLDQELDILTGYNADIQISKNFMLENDQSLPLNPQYQPWSANIEYITGEFVSYNGFNYTRTSASAGIGHSPTGTSSNNTWWNSYINTTGSTVINNAATGGPNTWEVVWPSSSTGQAGNFMTEVVGIPDPVTLTGNTHNGFSFQNTTGGTSNFLLRSVSRVASDITANGPSFQPNKDQVVKDGIPVPFSFANTLVWNATTWSPTVRYGTGSIVYYNNVPFMALRASTNVLPPASMGKRATGNNEWVPVALEPRFRLCISGYLQASTTGITVTPFVEWYDNNGNYITRVLARTTANNGSVAAPQSMIYDSFTYAPGDGINGRTTDDGGFTWTIRAGSMRISPFSGGCVSATTQRAYATVGSGVANCSVGVTFVTAPAAGEVQGLILRWQDDNNYLRATMNELDLKQSGSFTTLGTYSQSASVGDRLEVILNNATITCLVNNVQVLQVTNSFNQTGTIHGIIEEGGISVTNPGAQSSTVGVQI